MSDSSGGSTMSDSSGGETQEDDDVPKDIHVRVHILSTKNMTAKGQNYMMPTPKNDGSTTAERFQSEAHSQSLFTTNTSASTFKRKIKNLFWEQKLDGPPCTTGFKPETMADVAIASVRVRRFPKSKGRHMDLLDANALEEVVAAARLQAKEDETSHIILDVMVVYNETSMVGACQAHQEALSSLASPAQSSSSSSSSSPSATAPKMKTNSNDKISVAVHVSVRLVSTHTDDEGVETHKTSSTPQLLKDNQSDEVIFSYDLTAAWDYTKDTWIEKHLQEIMWGNESGKMNTDDKGLYTRALESLVDHGPQGLDLSMRAPPFFHLSRSTFTPATRTKEFMKILGNPFKKSKFIKTTVQNEVMNPEDRSDTDNFSSSHIERRFEMTMGFGAPAQAKNKRHSSGVPANNSQDKFSEVKEVVPKTKRITKSLVTAAANGRRTEIIKHFAAAYQNPDSWLYHSVNREQANVAATLLGQGANWQIYEKYTIESSEVKEMIFEISQKEGVGKIQKSWVFSYA